MRTLKLTDGPETVHTALRVLALRLTARPDTRALAISVGAARDALGAALATWQDARDARVAATGTVAFADALEDDAIAGLARRVRVLTGGEKDAPLWQKLFAARAPSDTTEGLATPEQAALARLVANVLLTDPAAASLADELPALDDARAAVEAAQVARAAAETDELTAWNALQLAETAARDAYNGAVPQLMILFPGGKRLVDSFFVTRSAPRAGEDEPDAS